MANKKVSDLTALGETPANDDVLYIVDTSATASKKVTYANLVAGAGGGILTQATKTVSNADVLAMKYDNTPLTLVTATSGKIHVPVSITIVATAAGSAETSSDDLRIGYDAATSTTNDYFIAIRDFMQSITGTITTVLTPDNATFLSASYPASAANKPIQAWCSDVFNGGWSMVVYTTYYSITV